MQNIKLKYLFQRCLDFLILIVKEQQNRGEESRGLRRDFLVPILVPDTEPKVHAFVCTFGSALEIQVMVEPGGIEPPTS